MKLNSKKTALLNLDFQKGILGMIPDSEVVVSNAVKTLDFARKGKEKNE